jgi:hypothetical protein
MSFNFFTFFPESENGILFMEVYNLRLVSPKKKILLPFKRLVEAGFSGRKNNSLLTAAKLSTPVDWLGKGVIEYISLKQDLYRISFSFAL